MPRKTGISRTHSARNARSEQPTSVTDSCVTRLRKPFAMREETLPHPAVVPSRAHAVDHGGIAAREPLEQPRDVVWVVLEIGVEGDEDLPARQAEADRERRRLAMVAIERDEVMLAAAGTQLSQDVQRRVGAAVVDPEALPRAAACLQGGLDLPRQLRDRLRPRPWPAR